MIVRLTTLYTGEQHAQMGDDAVARGFYRNDRRVFLPGTGYFCPWVWDYTGARQSAGKHTIAKEFGASNYLSPHYWRDWAHLRDPITVVCPNGVEWEIDRLSSNGDGWKVTGEWPNLTATPSIVAADYHGFLTNGEFTADLDGHSWSIPNIPEGYGRS